MTYSSTLSTRDNEYDAVPYADDHGDNKDYEVPMLEIMEL